MESVNTDLDSVIPTGQSLTDDHLKVFVYQILGSLKYIHSAGVVDQDLRPQNILVSVNCQLKFCDFGMAIGKLVKDDFDPPVYGTISYHAPEMLLSIDYGVTEACLLLLQSILTHVVGTSDASWIRNLNIKGLRNGSKVCLMVREYIAGSRLFSKVCPSSAATDF